MKIPNIMIIGLVGNSGAGKSTVCEAFQNRGFTVADCDDSARKVADNPVFLRELDERFPKKLLNSDGTLNRAVTADIIFADSEMRGLYNRIIFPYIIFDVIGEIKSAGNDVLLDAPTLFEAGLDIICDYVVGVTANPELCLKRICLRDKITEEQAQARLSSQHSAEFFMKNSNFIIENNDTKERLFERANSVIDRLKDIR